MSTQTESARRVVFSPPSFVRLLVSVAGAFFIVLGVLALSDAGPGGWTAPRIFVWGFGHTPLMAVLEIALGFGLVMAAPHPWSSSGTLFGFGVLMAVFGVVAIVDPGAFRPLLGVNRAAGWLYLWSGLGLTVVGRTGPVGE